MGKKGDKLTKESDLCAEILISKLDSIDGITSKKMFGGYGIFHEGKMFAMVNSKGDYFLKANEETKVDFEELNSTKHSRMPYYGLPEVVFEDAEKLQTWALKSIEISK